MIVREQTDGSLILVNQTDHAKLSGQYAAHWGNATFAAPRHRESAMRAATYHDCGWYAYETGPLYDPATETSPPFNKVPLSPSQMAAFAGGIAWLTAIDPYAGLLISRHRTGLWRGRYGAITTPAAPSRPNDDQTVTAFVEEHERAQARQLAAFDAATFAVDYQLLQVWDLLSLAFCTQDFQAATLEYVPTSYDGTGRAGVPMTLTLLDDGRIKIDSNPFDTAILHLNYVYRHLPTKSFDTQDAFRQAYFGAPLLTKDLIFV